MKKLLEKIRNLRIYIFLNQGDETTLEAYKIFIFILSLIAIGLGFTQCPAKF